MSKSTQDLKVCLSGSEVESILRLLLSPSAHSALYIMGLLHIPHANPPNIFWNRYFGQLYHVSMFHSEAQLTCTNNCTSMDFGNGTSPLTTQPQPSLSRQKKQWWPGRLDLRWTKRGFFDPPNRSQRIEISWDLGGCWKNYRASVLTCCLDHVFSPMFYFWEDGSLTYPMKWSLVKGCSHAVLSAVWWIEIDHWAYEAMRWSFFFGWPESRRIKKWWQKIWWFYMILCDF